MSLSVIHFSDIHIKGEEKKKLTVEDVLQKFEEVCGEEFSNDKALLG